MKHLLSWILISLSLGWSLSPRVSHATSESEFQGAQLNLQTYLIQLSLQDRALIRRTSSRNRNSLSPRLRNKFDERRSLKSQLVYWQNVVSLKKSLLELPSLDGPTVQPSPERIQEAELIAVTAIDAFGELKEKYKIGNSALLHNLAINMGLKKEGFCWHWTRDLRRRLKSLELKTFDLHWVSAREATILEHNTVVLVPKGQPFTKGLLLDGWRKAGKPFWMKVADDEKHPWKPSVCSSCEVQASS